MRIILMCCVLFSSIVGADAPSAQPISQREVQTFELTAIAPPVPALKYQLTFDALDKHPGNAAIRYFEASLLLTKEDLAQLEKVGNYSEPLTDPAFIAEARALPGPSSPLFDMLLLAGECDDCDWQAPLRERGVAALLPGLRYMRSISQIVRYAALVQVRDGHPVEALATLRLGYQLGLNVTREPVLIGGLVGLGISRVFDDTLSEIMRSPSSPNLYWALMNLPRYKPRLRHAMDGERSFVLGSIHSLDRLHAGQSMSASDWRSALSDMARLHLQLKDEPGKPSDLEARAVKEIFPASSAYYARTRNLSAQQVSAVDPAIVNGTFFYEQYQEALDDVCKLLELPYPQMRQKTDELYDRLAKTRDVPDENPLLASLPNFSRVVEAYARGDRRLAALTAVEAIRSYAASHDKKLPQQLEDITDTPAPLNPRSGQAFEYRIDGDSAVLSDREPKDYPLEYRIKIR